MTRMGFFTDTSVCIGCKACEVACKEWNLVPDDGTDASDLYRLTGMSYDVPSRSKPSAGSWFHSLQATSQALQPMHTDVSVKNPIRGCWPG